LWHTLIYCLRICWEGLKKTALGLVGHQDCNPAHPEHEEILTHDCGVWYESCKGIFSELGVGGVGAVQNTLKYRSINEYKL
jgi:hypothetical protein